MKSLREYIPRPTVWIFVIIKPGFLDTAADVVDIFQRHCWEVQSTRTKQLLPSEARELYKVHKNKDFYKDLCEYMSSGPSMAIIFTKHGTVSKAMFEQTNAIKNIIRSKYSKSDMKNCIHSSDNLAAMEFESSIYF